jgi:hypothetical protein
MLTILTPAELVPEAVDFLLKHGCTIGRYDTHNVVTFSEGTAQEELFPHPPTTIHFKLLLPDGCTMRQTYLRFLEQSVLFYPARCPHEQPHTIGA